MLLLAYGHLGRDYEIAAVKEKLKPVLIEEGAEQHSGLSQNYFNDRTDFERLLGGLRKAGVPEASFGVDFAKTHIAVAAR